MAIMPEPWELYSTPAAQAPPQNPWDLYAASATPPADTPKAVGQEAMDDPYSARNTIGRAATSIAGFLPDLAIKMQNSGLNPFDLPGRLAGRFVDKYFGEQPPAQTKIPEVTPALRAATGVPELPADASTGRQLGETALSVFAGGGGQGVGRAIEAAPTFGAKLLQGGQALVRNVAAPIAGSTVLGAAGEAVGGEPGQLLGSVVGGFGPGVRALKNENIRASARPDAAEIAAAANRLNVTPTAGMLGDRNVQARENMLSGRPGSATVINDARGQALGQMRDAADQAVEARRAFPPASPETADISTVARDAVAQGHDVSSAVQERLMQRIGPTAPVDVTPVLAELERIRSSTDPGTAAPLSARIDFLRQMLPRDAQGNPIADPQGRLNVDYQRFKDWRTALGKRFANLDPVPSRFASSIYDTATNAMRDTAIERGVHPQEFNLAQSITRNQIQAGQMGEKIGSSLGDTMAEAAGPRRFARWWTDMTPQEQAALAGPQAGTMSDVARLAQAYNYPTSQTGLTRSLGGQIGDVTSRAIGAGVGAGLGGALGIPGGHAIGAAVGAAGRTPLNWLAARRMQSAGTRNAMLNNTQPVSMAELMAAMQAANAGARPQQ